MEIMSAYCVQGTSIAIQFSPKPEKVGNIIIPILR